jgi:ubiquinone/menaquinone biosynthesis C-methylase UbiE
LGGRPPRPPPPPQNPHLGEVWRGQPTTTRAPPHLPNCILIPMTYARLIRWAFARFYHEFAWTYDTVAAAVSGGRWAAWGLATLPHLGGQILELGCGTGAIQQSLAARVGQSPAFGIDASPQMLAITQRKLAQADHPQRLVRAVAQALPFAPTSFDSIVATFPTEYIIDRSTLAEVWRVLRPGGRLVVALAASFSDDGLYQRLVDLLYRITLQSSPGVAPAVPPHSVLAQRLAELGFCVEERWTPVERNQVHLVIGRR